MNHALSTTAPIVAAVLTFGLAACVGALEAPRLQRWRFAAGGGAVLSAVALVTSVVLGASGSGTILSGSNGATLGRTTTTASPAPGTATSGTPIPGQPLGSTTGTSVGPAGGTALPTSAGGLRQAGPGVSATSVTLGFEVIDNLGPATSAAGAGGVNAFGDEPGQVSAIVDYVNKHGGIYGRKVVPVMEHYDATNQTDDTQSDQICTKFTEDDHVFATVLLIWDSDTDSIAQCYAQHQTMLFMPHEYNDSLYRSLWPYVWNVDGPSQNVMSASLVDGLASRRFFTGKLGILSLDIPEDHDAVDNVVMPRLRSIGFTNVMTQYIAYNTQESQAVASAELSFSQNGVDHVIFPGDSGGGLAAYFMVAAQSQQYFPYYGLDSDSQPAEALASGEVNPQQYQKMLGVGMAEVSDVADAQGDKFPDAQEKKCVDVMAGAGITFSSRGNATTALTFCDYLFALQQVTQAAGGTLSASAFGAAAPSATYASAIPYATAFSTGHPWGASAYRQTKFDTGCSCLVFVSGNIRAPNA